jgi:hypothetical protein
LYKTFGWTPQQVDEIPFDIRQDIILILNKEAAMQNKEMKKARKK